MSRIACVVAAATVAAVAVLGLAACGGGSDRVAAPSAYCTREASSISASALAILHQFDHGIYPADVSLIVFQTSLGQFAKHRCPPSVLGETLRRRLTTRQITRLLEILPAENASTVRRALGSA